MQNEPCNCVCEAESRILLNCRLKNRQYGRLPMNQILVRSCALFLMLALVSKIHGLVLSRNTHSSTTVRLWVGPSTASLARKVLTTAVLVQMKFLAAKWQKITQKPV